MFEFVRQWMRRWLGIEDVAKELRATERYVSKELRTLEAVDTRLGTELNVFKGKVEDLEDEVGDVRDEIQGIRDSQAHLMHRVDRLQGRVFPERPAPSQFTRDISELIISTYGPGEDFTVKGLPKDAAPRAKVRESLKELVERGLLVKVSKDTYRREV